MFEKPTKRAKIFEILLSKRLRDSFLSYFSENNKERFHEKAVD